MIHNISYEDYIDLYECFAGEILFEEEEEELDILPDRWGSVLELYIISKIFSVSILVFNTQKWDSKREKIINGKIIKNKCEKNVRLKIASIIGKEYINKNNPICIIWRIHNNNGHYMALYPKNIEYVKKNI